MADYTERTGDVGYWPKADIPEPCPLGPLVNPKQSSASKSFADSHCTAETGIHAHERRLRARSEHIQESAGKASKGSTKRDIANLQRGR
jgi:hypothetical protein